MDQPTYQSVTPLPPPQIDEPQYFAARIQGPQVGKSIVDTD